MPFDPTCGFSRRDGLCGQIGDVSWETYPSVGSITVGYFINDENTTVFNYDDQFWDYYEGGNTTVIELNDTDARFSPLVNFLDYPLFDYINEMRNDPNDFVKDYK
jgi:hypothetical protein